MKIKELVLVSCENISSAGYTCIGKCNTLVVLKMEFCSIKDEGLQSILQGCSNLEELTITNCENLTDTGFQAIARSTKLVKLNLDNSPGITEVAIIDIASGCPKLEILMVQNATDSAFKAIIKGCPKMKNMQLCPNTISDEGLLYLAEIGPTNIEYLDFGDYGTMTETGLEGIPKACPKMWQIALNVQKANLTKAIYPKHINIVETGF